MDMTMFMPPMVMGDMGMWHDHTMAPFPASAMSP